MARVNRRELPEAGLSDKSQILGGLARHAFPLRLVGDLREALAGCFQSFVDLGGSTSACSAHRSEGWLFR